MYTYNKDDKTYTFSSDNFNLDINVGLDSESSEPPENNVVDEKKETRKEIEVIDGGNELDISPVSDYIEIEKPKSEKKDSIIVPEEKK